MVKNARVTKTANADATMLNVSVAKKVAHAGIALLAIVSVVTKVLVGASVPAGANVNAVTNAAAAKNARINVNAKKAAKLKNKKTGETPFFLF